MEWRSVLINLTWAVVVVAIVALPVQCAQRRQDAVVQAVKAGADPILAKCAMEAGNHTSLLCITRATTAK
jgi:hypothetical protein